jgi:hypothetical protein
MEKAKDRRSSILTPSGISIKVEREVSYFPSKVINFFLTPIRPKIEG